MTERATMDYYVYIWTNTADGKQYVGKGKGRRAWGHLKKGSQSLLSRAMRKHGLEPFALRFLAHGLSEAEAFRDERLCIYLLEPAYNLTDGGEGMSGWVPSEETKAKISAKLTGRSLPSEHRAKISAGLLGSEVHAAGAASRRGRKLSGETRAKMSAAHQGQQRSPEQRERMSAAQRALGADPERRAQISKSKLGKPRSPEARARIAEGARRKWDRERQARLEGKDAPEQP